MVVLALIKVLKVISALEFLFDLWVFLLHPNDLEYQAL